MPTVVEVIDGYQGRKRTKSWKAHTTMRAFLLDCGPDYADLYLGVALGDVHPIIAGLTAYEIEYDGTGTTEGIGGEVYTHSIARVKYSDRSLETEGASIEEWDYAVDALTLPVGLLWQSDSTPINEPLTVSLMCAGLRIQQATVLANKEAIRGCLNKINRYTWHDCQPETLLYMGPTIRRQTNAYTGIREYLVHSFKWRERNWNQFFRSDTGVWDSPNYLPYGLANFTELGPI